VDVFISMCRGTSCSAIASCRDYRNNNTYFIFTNFLHAIGNFHVNKYAFVMFAMSVCVSCNAVNYISIKDYIIRAVYSLDRLCIQHSLLLSAMMLNKQSAKCHL